MCSPIATRVCSVIDSISRLSEAEIIMIMTNVMIAYNSEYQCNKCLKRYMGDDKKQAEHQRLKGCDGERDFLVAKHKKAKQFSFLPNLVFTKCPANWNNGAFQSLLSMYNEYKNGVNYFGSSPADTPAKYFEAMNLIDTLVNNEIEVKQDMAKKLNKLRTKPRGK